MNFSARARAAEPRAIATRLAGTQSSWQHQVTSIALALGTLVLGYAPLESAQSALVGDSAAASIAADPNAKAAREAKRAERAAAREAKKKERASRSNKSDDRYAKAKSGKGSSGSSVDLGDNDPLEGL
jgi:hypothetical protein